MPVTDVEKDVDALTMTITAQFDADAERLWELWSDPRQLERWWSPPSHSSTFLEHELTVGSRTTYFMTAPTARSTTAPGESRRPTRPAGCTSSTTPSTTRASRRTEARRG
jgi:uncharacterized protein YndB with AHSA1/START domain